MRIGKSLVESKIFWVNVVGLTAWGAGYLPPQYGAPAVMALNILLRALTTSQPITSVLPDDDKKLVIP